MLNLNSLYGERFQSYFIELQKYMQYMLSGHIAVVLLFTLGAAGYSYSEWLKLPHPEFPFVFVASFVLSVILVPNKPALLFRHADQYYLLPMAESLPSYIRPALHYSVFVVALRSLVVLVALLPMLARVGGISSSVLLLVAVIVVLLAYWNVHTKYVATVAWVVPAYLDFSIRFIVLYSLFYSVLSERFAISIVIGVAGILYLWYMKRESQKPFPFDRMIASEQQRMQRFYQFANYFTEVPHLRSKVSRRAFLDGALSDETLNRFLLSRSFIRKDELFYTWLRLAILMVLAPLFSFSLLAAVFVVVFTFAISLQLYQGLLYNQLFRMDMLYPQANESRETAAIQLTRKVAYSPLFVASVLLIWQHGLLYGIVALVSGIVLSEWFYLRKKKKQ
ncbi:ABC transporter permease [Chryseomicrobium palamuruense]|uniref:ABC transporter permease n=1 Tax=Chryseomicrobium palamuruense TaxID=682973 RepID=A0ABV8UQK0_9BACL